MVWTNTVFRTSSSSSLPRRYVIFTNVLRYLRNEPVIAPQCEISSWYRIVIGVVVGYMQLCCQC